MRIPHPVQRRAYFRNRTWRITTREALVSLFPRVFRLVKFYEAKNPAIPGGWEQRHYAVHQGPRPAL